jgi:oligo-1,6-glucosidase
VPWTLQDFKQVFATWDAALTNGWGSIFLGNHDFARMVSRWGNDNTYHHQSAKLLLTLLLTLRGTPFIYQGDELGMTNLTLNSIDEVVDIESRNAWEVARSTGKHPEEFLKVINYAGRDNARTPVQWDNSEFAGFSTVVPWMPVNPNKETINVSTQESDAGSILNYFRKMVRLRKVCPALSKGSFKLAHPDDTRLFAYYRSHNKQTLFVAVNFSDEPLDISLPEGTLLIGNYLRKSKLSMLRPWEAVVINV